MNTKSTLNLLHLTRLGILGLLLLTSQVHADTLTKVGQTVAPRFFPTLIRLQDGRILVTGGFLDADTYDTRAEIFDPITSQFTKTGSMRTARAFHAAVLLQTGKVLIVKNQSAELYDPTTGTFSITGSPLIDHSSVSATLLKDGRVLVLGGYGAPFAELYDPNTGRFTKTGQMSVDRENASSSLLADGRILVVGGLGNKRLDSKPTCVSVPRLGFNTCYNRELTDVRSTAEIYDPKTGLFSAPLDLGSPNGAPFALAISGNRVLVANPEAKSLQTFDAKSGRFSVPSLTSSLTNSLVIGAFAPEINQALLLSLTGSTADLTLYHAGKNESRILPTLMSGFIPTAAVALSGCRILLLGDTAYGAAIYRFSNCNLPSPTLSPNAGSNTRE